MVCVDLCQGAWHSGGWRASPFPEPQGQYPEGRGMTRWDGPQVLALCSAGKEERLIAPDIDHSDLGLRNDGKRAWLATKSRAKEEM